MTFNYKTKPYQFQQEIVATTWYEPAYGLFLEMGLGKTKICIDTLGYQFLANDIKAAIVIAPKSVTPMWPHELAKHMTDSVEWDYYVWKGQKTQREQKEFARFMGRNSDRLKVLCIHHDAIKIKRAQVALNEFIIKYRQYTLIVDESTAFKNHKAQRSKDLYRLARLAKYKRILTGTPVTQGPLDLWGQCLVLGERVLGHRNYFSFKGTYAIERERIMGNRRFKEIVGYHNLPDLKHKLLSFSSILKKEEVLDLPDKIYRRVNVQLSKAQQIAYAELKNFAVTQLEGEAITANNALTLLSRLQQIVAGQMKMPDGKYVRLDNERIDICSEIIAESASKVVVWSTFKEAQKALYEALREPYGAVQITADMSQEARFDAVQTFQHSDHCRVFVGNPASSGHGLTLTAASTVIYYANGFSLEKRLQSEDRCHRIGQQSNVLYIDLVSMGTVDEKVLKALKAKEDLASKITGNPAYLKELL